MTLMHDKKTMFLFGGYGIDGMGTGEPGDQNSAFAHSFLASNLNMPRKVKG